jgi:hypothetical protein
VRFLRVVRRLVREPRDDSRLRSPWPTPTICSDRAPLAAREIYARIAAEPERDARHASALYNLARLLTDPAAGPRDYRAAQLAFDRLLKEYPKGEWEADARAWNAALTDLAAREVELGGPRWRAPRA